eukprot:TRINITY_DN5347_c0_g1_i1.p1 TRINITY_DN5347_c0_g1~~TRINITY_DN5347_c0_g1_i1.p1  ORF type:complete len:730 (+),score=142.18 TRINITY_DN5347_c0_g1_i1:42-2231(+)
MAAAASWEGLIPQPNVHEYKGTDWKLRQTPDGQQVWDFVGDEASLGDDAQAAADTIKRLIDEHIRLASGPRSTATNAADACKLAVDYYAEQQRDDGHWAADYGGPMFLMPGLVIMTYITGAPLSKAHKFEMSKFLRVHQRVDGGWPLHIEGPSTVFGSCLNYIALRIMGMKRDDPAAVKAREFILKYGGALYSAAWGKFWMCTLGVMDWEGTDPVQPELWWLPKWFPIHPSKMWCHCRVVYLPMSYVYGRRATCRETPLIRELREELYAQPYSSIPWSTTRQYISKVDKYTGLSAVYKLGMHILSMYEKVHSKWARKAACDLAMDHIHHEDMSTKYIDIGPVNKIMNMLAVWYAEGNSERFKKHYDRLFDYLWVSDDGMKMQGYNGSQLWDTSFAAQAIYETGMFDHPSVQKSLQKAYHYIDVSQVDEEVDQGPKYYRHISKGAWPFSTKDHGWPISDCTSEALKASLSLRKLPFVTKFADQRYFDAVNIILSLQNKDSGGWATYELMRAGAWMELMNPSQIYGKIMVDYPYVECSSACIQALLAFKAVYPQHRAAEIRDSIAGGVRCIKSLQRADGSWYGSWGVCFTYGIWFGIEGLCAVGEGNGPEVRRAVQFLLSKQNSDGGWGESYLSCVTHEYVQHKNGSQVVNTAWALLSLLTANHGDADVLQRAAKFLISRQLSDGNWAQEGISGVFNANCMITYSQYKNIFPIWALARFNKRYPKHGFARL